MFVVVIVIDVDLVGGVVFFDFGGDVQCVVGVVVGFKVDCCFGELYIVVVGVELNVFDYLVDGECQCQVVGFIVWYSYYVENFMVVSGC